MYYISEMLVNFKCCRKFGFCPDAVLGEVQSFYQVSDLFLALKFSLYIIQIVP